MSVHVARRYTRCTDTQDKTVDDQHSASGSALGPPETTFTAEVEVAGERYLAPATAVDLLLAAGASASSAYGYLVRHTRDGAVRTLRATGRARLYHAGDVHALAGTLKAR
jgi:hypothetical protein